MLSHCAHTAINLKASLSGSVGRHQAVSRRISVRACHPSEILVDWNFFARAHGVPFLIAEVANPVNPNGVVALVSIFRSQDGED